MQVRRLLLLTILVLGPAASPAESSGTLRPGVAYHYVKSNLDDTDSWHVTTYVPSSGRLDVLKWGEEPGQVVEVTADLDPARCVAQHLEQWNLQDGSMVLSMWGALSADGQSMGFNRQGIAPILVRGSGRPLHVYGFDLQSMDPAPRCLGKTRGVPIIGLVGVNPVPDAAPPLVDYGPIRVEALGEAKVGDVACRRFRLVGKGFTLLTWFSRDDGHVVRAESMRPDSHDWTSFKLQLLRTERMNPFQWQAFRARVLGRFVRNTSAPAPRDRGDGGQR